LRYHIELKFMGRTVYDLKTEDMTEDRLQAQVAMVQGQYAANRFTKNLALEIVTTPITEPTSDER
jgi:hypothetical protein